MADNSYKIQLGVDLKVNDIRDRITQYNKNTNNAKLRLGIKLDTDDLKQQINKLNLGNTGKGKGVAIPINTQSLETSLKEVKGIIADIKASMGTLDGGDMKSLLSSVNQIATALGKAENESDNLVKSLNVLSKKDFNINLGIDMNKKGLNTIGYGRAARKQVIPELESQIQYLENLFGGQQATMNKLASQGRNVGFDVFTDFGDFNSESAIKKMEAMEKYINSLKKLAAIDNVNLDGFNEIHKDASALINDITGIENAVDKAGDVPEKLKNLFGGSVDGEGLSKQLDNIVADLGEIKTVIQGISSGVSLEGLTQSFDRLSDSIEQLVKNCTTAKQAINDSVGNVGKSVGQGSGEDEIKKTSNELTKLKNLAHQIGQLDFKIVKSDYKDEVNQVREFERQLELLKIQYNETLNSLNGKDIDIGSEITKEFTEARNKIAEFEAKVADTKRKLAEDIKTNIGTNVVKDISKVRSDFNNLAGQSDDLRQKLDLLDNIKIDLDTAAANNDIESLIRLYDNYEKVLKDVKAQLDINKRTEHDINNAESLTLGKENAMLRLRGLFSNNSEAAKKFATELNRIQKELDECGDTTGLRRINKEITNLGQKIKESGVQTQTFGQKLKKQFSQYSSYLSIASLFMYAEQGLRSMFEQVKLIDTAMTELKKVTDETDDAYNQFLSNVATRAKEIGTTIDGLVSSTADFARLGYGFEDAQGLAEVANIYAVVGDEIEGVEQATESLISTMAAFKDSAGGMSNTDFAMSIIDKFNEIGNNFAISSGGIGEALERSASSLDAANNTIDESIALITAANTVVQDPAKVGNAFKTISMRIRGAKTELAAAGEDTEGMVESTAKLRQEILALSGVDIMKDNNTFKSTYAIMDELAQKWQSLTDIQQASVTELLAGKRQGNIMSSLMNNFDTAREALQTSLQSAGSAMREHEKWQESLEARINSLKASWQSLSQTFLSSDFLKNTIDGLTKLVDVIETIIDRFGVIGTGAGMLGLRSIFKNGFALDEKGNHIGKYAGMFQGLGETLKTDINLMKTAASQSGTLSDKLRRVGSVGKQTGKHIGDSFKASSKQIKTMAKDIGALLAIMGVIKVIQDIADWMSELGEETETTAEKFDRISSELSDAESELSSLESELSNVESQMDALLAKDELTYADEEELSRLRQVSSELERQIELTETLQKSLQKSLNSTAISAYGDYVDDTSFYSDDSKADRKEKGKATGSSIGNIVGLIAGGVLAYLTGGTSAILMGAGIGSVAGSGIGSFAGGNIANASYANERTVREVLDNMEAERFRLEKAAEEAYDAYTKDPTSKTRETWEEAETALSDYNNALSSHMNQLSEYYNSIDYTTLNKEQMQDYIQMGDDLDKYNIAMGVVGAKSTALDRIFSDELITDKAEDLRAAIEATLNSGEEINLVDFDGEQFTEIKERLADMGLTIIDCVGYFEDLKVAQEDAANYETYDMVSSIAAMSDGVTALTDAFAEFNEEGTVSSKTLTELHEVFGTLGEDWTNYVDVMTNGIATIEDAREATEQLVEAYTNDLFQNGGIKFAKFNKETDRYEFDENGYKTYLSTVNQLQDLGVENAKEYLDAAQQQAMIRESASQMMADAAQEEALLAKETLTAKEQTYLTTLQGKELDDYILEIESKYGVRLKDSGLIQKQYDLNESKAKVKEYQAYLNDIGDLNGGLYAEFHDSLELSEQIYKDQQAAQEEWEKWHERGYGNGKVFSERSWEELGSAFGEATEMVLGSWMGFDIDTNYDKFKEADQKYQDTIDLANDQREKRNEFFKELLTIAEDSDIDLSSIDAKPWTESVESIYDLTEEEIDTALNTTVEGKDGLFDQVYEKVKTDLNTSIDKYEEDIKGLESEIEARLNNLGLEIDFGRNFDKIIIDGLKGKIEQFNTAQSEMFSSGGLSTDSIIAMDEIFGDLAGYDSSKLFENTANGVRLNTEAYKKYSDQFKKVNIGAIEDKMSELSDTYVKTRDELNKLTYGTIEYQQKAQELEGIGKQIEANEELLSQYKALFSSYNEWQRAEAAGSERNMYETVLGGFETVGDEISRGWIDEGTKEFLELLKGEKATIIDGNGNKKEINIATASVQELKKVWKDLDKNIEHTTHSVRDFFTVDEEGNSTSDGVKNFLDAIGQMEEEKFGGKDVVKRKGDQIVGFDFQMVGGDKVIAEALGVSEELVQIMKRASIDAGFVVTFDGSFEQLDVLKERAEAAAKEMNKKLQAANKATIEIDVNADSVEEIQPQIDKIMETFGKKDVNGKLTGEIDTTISGAQEALGIVRTLQSMLDEVTRPAYMNIETSQVEEELRDPLYQLQQLRLLTEQEHLLKFSGGDTSKLEEDKQKIYDYFEKLDPEIKAKVGLVDADGKGITEKSFNKLTDEQKIELKYVDENGKPIKDYSEALKKKLSDGSLSIEATVDLQLEMADSLDILAQTALFEQGKISEEEYTKRIQVYLDAEVDTSDVEDEIDTSKIKELLNERGIEENHQVKILAMAEVLGTEDLDTLYDRLNGLNNKQIKVLAEVLGKIDVEKLKTTVEGLDDKTVEAIAKALGEGDVKGLKTTINGLDDKTVQAIAEAFGYSSVKELNGAIDDLDPKTVQAIAEALGITDVDSLRNAVNRLTDKNVKATATTFGENKLKNLKSAIDKIKDKTVTITTKVKKLFTKVFGGDDKDEEGGSDVNGTANVNGATGRAFARGDWRTKKSERSLVGELGREIIVTPNNQWYTVGDSGAEFVNIPKNSIVFNHRQTEELLKNGKVTSGGGRARALVNGTAFLGGTAHRGDAIDGMLLPDKPSFKVGYDYNSSSDSDSKKSQNVFDWIEVAIERIEREIDNLDRTANNVYKSWSSRNKALASEINEVSNEIALQESAYKGYMNAANEIGLSSEWKKKVQTGAIDIDNITDDTLKEKIDDYQKYYEKALKAKDAAEELRETEADLYAQRFEHIQSQYDGILQGYEHTESMLNEYISQAEAQGHLVSEKYYTALINNEKQNIEQLKKEQAELIAERDKAVADGKIVKGSEAWLEQCAAIDEVTQSIEEANTALIEYNNAIRDIEWQQFDLIQERISDITAESEFLIELMSNKDLFDDNGKFTEQGVATVGLHALNYNTAMYQSDEYGAEIAKLDKQIAKDPYDQELINRRRELIELQRESILAAEDEKQAIKDLIEEGINAELDSLQELIDKKNEELDSEKELYEYQKKVQEQTESIASLRKQMAAYENDNSEEAKAKIQELRVSLQDAETELQETEWDKYINDTSTILDALYTDYENILNSRLDNIDYLLQQVIDGINATAGEGGTLSSALGTEGAIAQAIVSAVGENGSIKNILNAEVTKVGTTLSNAMNSIWSVGDGNAKSILTTYGTDFQSKLTTTNVVLNGIKISIDRMVDDIDKDAQKKVKANKTSTSAKKNPTKNTSTIKKPSTTTKKSSGDGKAKVGDKVKFVSGQYYYDSQGKKPLGSKYQGKQVYITKINTAKWATHPYHISTGSKLGSGDLGWLKLNQLSGYAAGKKKISNSEYAWTQENGQEFIVRPSDGAILTPVAKGDSVLNATATGNIWQMANNPAEFIKNNLGLDSANIPNGANVNNNVTQHFENINFNMPNVHSYNELITEMQRDPKFEKLVLAMTVDQIAGKSKLGKNKAIR